MRIPAIVTLHLFLTLHAVCGDGFVFKIVQNENSTYRTSTHFVSETELDFRGDEALLNEIRSRGVVFPVQMVEEKSMVMVAETASKGPDGRIPFAGRVDSMVTIKRVGGELQAEDSPGVMDTSFRMWGSYGGGSPKIDSIKGRRIDSAVASIAKNMMSQLFQSIQYPDSQLTIGSSFSHSSPMSFQLQAGLEVQFTITTAYTLRRLDARLAHFDIVQTYEMSTRSAEMKMELKGSGTGTLIFDRELTQTIYMDTKASTSMTVPLGKFTMVSSSTSATEMSVTVATHQ
jgi:hypothetical protein